MSQGIDFAALAAQVGTQEEVLPVGEYDVVVKSAKTASSKSSGKPQISVKFAVENGPHANRSFYNTFTISTESPGALSIFFTQMKALGLDTAFFATGPSLDAVAQNLVNKRARVTTGHREYNNRTYVDLQRINPATGTGPAVGPGAMPGGPLAQSTPAAVPVPAPAPSAPVAGPPAPPAPPVQAAPAAVPSGTPAPPSPATEQPAAATVTPPAPAQETPAPAPETAPAPQPTEQPAAPQQSGPPRLPF